MANPSDRPPPRQLARDAARVFGLVWRAAPRALVAVVVFTLLSGALPAGIAWAAKQIVDAVQVEVMGSWAGRAARLEPVLGWVALEFLLVAAQRAVGRGLWLTDSLLRTTLGQHVNEQILEKALTLELPDYEDAETLDLLTRARRGASYRPLSFVLGAFNLLRDVMALLGYGALLFTLAPWAVLLVVGAAVPAFVLETRFSQDAFRLFRWRAPEARRQNYYESVIANEPTVKEVKLFGLGPLFLERYREVYRDHFEEDRKTTARQALLGYLLGLLGVLAFYGCYGWVALRTARGELSFGDMTMFLLVFKQARDTLGRSLGGVREQYETLLYVTDLFTFLDRAPTGPLSGAATTGPSPERGIEFVGVTFTYPGAAEPTLRGVDLHLPPGHKLAIVGENGAGKTTLIKLMTGLYQPSEGEVRLDGLPLTEWDPTALRSRMGVIFQDFVRYQLLVGENIGVGDAEAIDDPARWRAAADKGLAHEMIERLPKGYETQLGKWFDDGRELSGGQWQKIALARAFMREQADILVLDEPTASMDARAETKIFERFRALAEDRMAILISHRFSTVRMADSVAVIHEGQVVEQGTHHELVQLGGRYARLFDMQAKGYR